MDKFTLTMTKVRRLVIETPRATRPIVVNQPDHPFDMVDDSCTQAHQAWFQSCIQRHRPAILYKERLVL